MQIHIWDARRLPYLVAQPRIQTESFFKTVPPPHAVPLIAYILLELASCALALPTPVAARTVALDTDFGLHFLHVRSARIA